MDCVSDLLAGRAILTAIDRLPQRRDALLPDRRNRGELRAERLDGGPCERNVRRRNSRVFSRSRGILILNSLLAIDL